MSVGSDGTFNLLTDKTLITEDMPADAKAVGDKFKMVYTKTETDGKDYPAIIERAGLSRVKGA